MFYHTKTLFVIDLISRKGKWVEFRLHVPTFIIAGSFYWESGSAVGWKLFFLSINLVTGLLMAKAYRIFATMPASVK